MRYALQIPEFLQETSSPAILRQLKPSPDELQERPHFTTNPLKEQAPSPDVWRPYLLQKYAGRALLVTTNACFGNCRFCFRQHVRTAETLTLDFSEALEALRQNETLSELILSGGDPLTLSDEELAQLLENLEQIPHLRRLRFHTRAVSFCPSRITPRLLDLFRAACQTIWMVLHINHADELTDEPRAAIQNLRCAGIPLLQQGVLLRGINDDLATLQTLYETLANEGVLPYYLHQLDRVQGAAHFEVPLEQGRALLRKLRETLPGYAVPRYVQEIPGESSKRIL